VSGISIQALFWTFTLHLCRKDGHARKKSLPKVMFTVPCTVHSWQAQQQLLTCCCCSGPWKPARKIPSWSDLQTLVECYLEKNCWLQSWFCMKPLHVSWY